MRVWRGLPEVRDIKRIELLPFPQSLGKELRGDYWRRVQDSIDRRGLNDTVLYIAPPPNPHYQNRNAQVKAMLFLISAIAKAGFRPFGHVLLQFRIV
jgi:hypothetical protein